MAQWAPGMDLHFPVLTLSESLTYWHRTPPPFAFVPSPPQPSTPKTRYNALHSLHRKGLHNTPHPLIRSVSRFPSPPKQFITDFTLQFFASVQIHPPAPHIRPIPVPRAESDSISGPKPTDWTNIFYRLAVFSSRLSLARSPWGSTTCWAPIRIYTELAFPIRRELALQHSFDVLLIYPNQLREPAQCPSGVNISTIVLTRITRVPSRNCRISHKSKPGRLSRRCLCGRFDGGMPANGLAVARIFLMRTAPHLNHDQIRR